MAALEFNIKGDPLMEGNLKKLGVGGDLPVYRRVQISSKNWLSSLLLCRGLESRRKSSCWLFWPRASGV
jgi:hypothetical protein